MKDRNASNFDQERIEAEAADWIAKIDRGLVDTEQDAFFDWLAADPRHGECLAEDKAEWDAFDVLDEWRPVDSKLPNPDLLKQPARAKAQSVWLRAPFWIGAVAAVFVVGYFLPQWRDAHPDDRAHRLSNENYASSYERHVLEDGSTVELNRGSQVSVRYTAEERRLELISGEAHFSVVPDADRPFVVTARNSEVVAVGTAFNVKIKLDSLEVIVTKGKVRFEPVLAQNLKNTVESTPGTPGLSVATELEAGFRAIQNLDGAQFAPKVFKLTTTEVATRLAWKDAVLDFNSRPLSEVVSAFNRHNHSQIVIGDEELLDMKVTVALKPDNHKGFVRLLEMTAGIEAIQQDSSTVILRRPR